MSSPLVWFITGTSTGFGRDLTIAALKRGDKVIATARARSIHALDDLKALGADTIELDVTADLDSLRKIAAQAVKTHGRIDVVVNNAAYIAVGALEENTPEESFQQYNTNIFGALNVTRAFLPYMRERKSGTIIFMGSLGGWQEVPNAGLYASTKYAIRGISETLHAEISPLGLRSTCIDFGYFRTDFLNPTHRAHQENRIEDYRPITTASEAALQAYNGKQPGNPLLAVQVMLDLAHGTGGAAGKAFPRVLTLGSDAYGVVKTSAENTLARLSEWESVTKSTDF